MLLYYTFGSWIGTISSHEWWKVKIDLIFQLRTLLNFFVLLRNRVSSGFKDRGLYETLYPFCIFFVWITFKRRDYELIRTEIGRLLRSDSFNSEIRVESILEEENRKPKARIKSDNKKEIILNKYQENKILLNEFKSKIQ